MLNLQPMYFLRKKGMKILSLDQNIYCFDETAMISFSITVSTPLRCHSWLISVFLTTIKNIRNAPNWSTCAGQMIRLFNLPESMKVMYERVAPSLQENASVKCQEYLDNIQLVVFQRQTMIWNCSRENSIVQDMAAML